MEGKERYERTVGDTNLSIGTHLAIESLFPDEVELYDEEREFDEVDPKKYQYHIFNVYTLLRNVLGSIEVNDKIGLLKDTEGIASLLVEEIKQLSYLYQSMGVRLVLILPDYKKAIKGMNNMKKPMEVKGWLYFLAMESFLKAMFKSESVLPEVLRTSHLFPRFEKTQDNRPFLVTSHIGIDLLNKGDFDLLESHTGALVKRSQFGKKYHPIGETDLSDYPFCGELYYLLGDRQIVKPFDLKFRLAVRSVAEENKWTHRTTVMKVMYDVNRNLLLKGMIGGFRNPY